MHGSRRVRPVTRLLGKHIRGRNQRAPSAAPSAARHKDLNTHQLRKLCRNKAPGCRSRLPPERGEGGSLVPFAPRLGRAPGGRGASPQAGAVRARKGLQADSGDPRDARSGRSSLASASRLNDGPGGSKPFGGRTPPHPPPRPRSCHPQHWPREERESKLLLPKKGFLTFTRVRHPASF